MALDFYKRIQLDIMNDPMNKSYTDRGLKPLFLVNENSKILIIGQAPGTKAEQGAMTWNDLSGDKLRSWLDVSKETFYDVNVFGQMPMDFYYPGKGKTGDLPPRKGFADKWHPEILKHLEHVELIILVGSYSQKYYLKDHKTLTERIKCYKDYLPRFFVLPHPSPLNFRWQQKNPWFMEEVVPKLQVYVKRILLK
ncbi:MAG TPA: uracil-DNA glycosylase family protein [Acholeplasma sp.]|jgi:uracil-DNA glycosylase|nr:uracil-DNA glycosylase family protein [Acholeplasma sp.]